MFNFFKKKKRFYSDIDPDEIFLDSENLSSLDTQQLEGKIERPISKKTIYLLFGSFIFVCLIFSVKLHALQIKEGDSFLSRSRNNSLSQKILFSDRGVIYDRNLVELSWNESVEELGDSEDVFSEEKQLSFPLRAYIEEPGFGHVLGYVGYPEKDSKGFYWQKEFIGKAGIESAYNESLNGRNGLKLIEHDVQGNITSENTVEAPIDGENIILTIDADLQKILYSSIKDLTESNNFIAGSAAVMDIDTGELLALTSYPEYSPEILSLGEDSSVINNYLTDSDRPFLNRAISSYAPGSIVKPYFALAALYEGIIDPDEWLVSNGQIVIPNPFNPENPTIFKDNHVHGMVDMRKAIAVSANTYFYEIGGGFNGRKGLGIARLEKYMREFGFGNLTGFDTLGAEAIGVIPSPEWKKKTFADGTWRVGDTYNSSIGQYGFQLTPIQALRGVATIASRGIVVDPHIVAQDTPEKINAVATHFEDYQYTVVHEGMRQAVTDGTSSFFDLSYVAVAAKTGTAQVGAGNKYSHSWSTGFFPYEDPKYAFVVFMERAPKGFTLSANYVMRAAFNWMHESRPEYLNLSI
jgi:penicillin-binding protein 2